MYFDPALFRFQLALLLAAVFELLSTILMSMPRCFFWSHMYILFVL